MTYNEFDNLKVGQYVWLIETKNVYKKKVTYKDSDVILFSEDYRNSGGCFYDNAYMSRYDALDALAQNISKGILRRERDIQSLEEDVKKLKEIQTEILQMMDKTRKPKNNE